jgi:predicted HTH transcriptional regulator
MVELGYAQNEGQGIRTIMSLTKETAGKEPEFDISPHWFRVAIPAYNPLLVNLVQTRESALKTQEPDIDVSIDLPAIQFDFSQLKDILGDADPMLKEELARIEDSLDEVSANTEKEKLKKPMNKLGRFLRKLEDEDSTINMLLSDTKKGIDLARKLGRTYNKFAQWLALPEVPELFLKEKP